MDELWISEMGLNSTRGWMSAREKFVTGNDHYGTSWCYCGSDESSSRRSPGHFPDLGVDIYGHYASFLFNSPVHIQV
jgi:hypothetical protein